MPKATSRASKPFSCDLCGHPLSNLNAALRIHQRSCPSLVQFQTDSISSAHQSYAAQTAAQQPLAGPAPMDIDPPPIIDPPPPEPTHRASGLPNRRTRAPAKFKDAAPPRPPRLRLRNPLPQVQPEETRPPTRPPTPEPLKEWVKTTPNEFGLYKVYPRRPTHDPDISVTLKDVFQVPEPHSETVEAAPPPAYPWHYPFANPTIATLIKYHVEEENAGSVAGFDRLVLGCLKANKATGEDGIDLNEIPDEWSAQRELDLLDKKGVEPLGVTKAWINGSVTLRLPCVGVHQKEADAPEYTVKDIYFRPLLDTAREALQGPMFHKLHTTPFALRFDPKFDPSSPDIELGDARPPLLNSQGVPDLPKGHQDVYGELYTSAAMLEAYQAIPQPPPPQSPEDPVESIILAFMEWSDATHLAQFGSASLWPLYSFLGNQSKYQRARPTENVGFHQAYFASLPDDIRDSYRAHYGCDMPDELYTHLKRELFHKIWELLLDGDFMDAYENGIKIKCFDGFIRLVFPRFFVYGADYPEKVLLACIRSLGGCPCPRCLVAKALIAETGTANDMKRRENIREDTSVRRFAVEAARTAIFEEGLPVNGASVNRKLKAQSWTPTRNAFWKLNTAKNSFNPHAMLLPDALHEFDIGVAKAKIIHTIRMLDVFKNLQQFDQRFRQINTFGRGTIRKFRNNVSELKQHAGRDYEDILQCILPVLEGLFPQHQKLVDQAFFELALWQGYAKLRLHTTETIKLFRAATTALCTTIRRFARETANIKTYELPQEQRRREKKTKAASALADDILSAPSAAPAPATTEPTHPPLPSSSTTATGAQDPPATTQPKKKKRAAGAKLEKPFNLITYKLHSLPDYADAIVRIGTTDSTSTQIGELAHRQVKRFYHRTNKRGHTKQIAKLERRGRLMRAMWERRQHYKDMENKAKGPTTAAPTTVAPNPGEPIPRRRSKGDRLRAALRPKATKIQAYVPPDQHHYISDSHRTYWDLRELPGSAGDDSDSPDEDGSIRMDVDQEPCDPGLIDWNLKLMSHILRRDRGLEFDGDNMQFSSEELTKVLIKDHRVYTHATMRVNYTTYDIQRDQDVINVRSRPFIIVHAQDPQDPHPFWYGDVKGILHVYVSFADRPLEGPKRMEVLFVRWFQRDMSYRSGFKQKRLPRVRYMPHSSPDAFGFLDPLDVIRGSHLIPAFHHHRTSEYLPKSIMRREADKDKDWTFYYANIFVDRDMVMRYHENVIGHRRHFYKPTSNDPPTQDQPRSELEPPSDDLGNPDTPDEPLSELHPPDIQEGPESSLPPSSLLGANLQDEDDEDDEDYVSGSSESESETESESEEDEDRADLFGDDAIRARLGYDT
ncbi:hypothetical protein C8F01DRAFT_1124234 [Mycena amicta]|nr:hypothetical protein C8F01DRAFT_1124234 [Mycena amicta]